LKTTSVVKAERIAVLERPVVFHERLARVEAELSLSTP